MLRLLALVLIAPLLLAPAAQAQTDFSIVPGERIGPYRLDMTVAELQAALAKAQPGKIQEQITTDAPFVPHRLIVAEGVGIDAHISIFGVRVLAISTWKPTYRLAFGLGVGARENTLNRIFPGLTTTVGGAAGLYTFENKRGLAVVVDQGQIREMIVFPPGAAASLFEVP